MDDSNFVERRSGWADKSYFVLQELKRLNENVRQVDKKLTAYKDGSARELSELMNQFATLKAQFEIKSGIWGLLGGGIPVIILIILKVFGKI